MHNNLIFNYSFTLTQCDGLATKQQRRFVDIESYFHCEIVMSQHNTRARDLLDSNKRSPVLTASHVSVVPLQKACKESRQLVIRIPPPFYTIPGITMVLVAIMSLSLVSGVSFD